MVGIRFRNSSGVECFIGTAINVLASNEAIRRTILEEAGPSKDGNRIRRIRIEVKKYIQVQNSVVLKMFVGEILVIHMAPSHP